MYARKISLFSLGLIIFLTLPAVGRAQPFDLGGTERSQDVGEPTGEGEYEEGPTIADPLEPWNRAMYHFNDKLYFWVLKPVAKGYGKVVPEWGRLRVRDFFHNLAAPIRIVNCTLQLKFEAAGFELFRFAANTTAGLGGIFDLAENSPQKKDGEEDLGQTLGSYGIGDGFYIVWPLMGSSSIRDSVGLFGDGFLYPVNYLSDTKAIIGIDAYDDVNKTSLRIGEYEDFKESALDPYIALRDAYIQYRTNKVKK